MGKGKISERNPTLVSFGAAVRRERMKLGISQEEAAERSGLHRTYFADVERGTRNIGLLNILAIAKGLGVEVQELLK
jgi:transcriptional regulator with XRE-family HTH domain